MEKDIIAILSEKNALFSKRQRAVADFICEYPDRAAFMTAEMLASAAGVSESTVVRFALELGFEGYPDMRKSIQELLRRRFSPAEPEDAERAGENFTRLFAKALGEYGEAVAALAEGENAENFGRAVKILHKAKRVFLLGGSGGQDAALYLWRGMKLLRDGAVLVLGDAYAQLSHITAEDALLCFYPAPSQRESFGAARFAHDSGAAVIAVSGREGQTGLAFADSLILCGGKTGPYFACAVSVYAAAAVLLEGLGAAVGQEPKAARKKIETIRQEYEINEC